MKEIDPGLHSLQAEVGGDIGATYPYSDPVALVCNDEGKLIGLDAPDKSSGRRLQEIEIIWSVKKDRSYYHFMKMRKTDSEYLVNAIRTKTR